MTTRTRAPKTLRTAGTEATATVAPQRIPADMMGTGFVAVAIRFPAVATAHRVVHVTITPDCDTPTETNGHAPIRRETRAACQEDADVADRVYELSAPMAHHRGAVVCPDPVCFGGAA